MTNNNIKITKTKMKHTKDTWTYPCCNRINKQNDVYTVRRDREREWERKRMKVNDRGKTNNNIK
jgi:hypothetical protein